MTTIANLRVKLSANTTALHRGLASAKDAIRTFSVAAGAAAAGLGVLAVRISNNARETLNLIDQSGLSAKAFQALTLAAAKYGITQEQVTDGLHEFSNVLGEALLEPTSGKADAFRKLALDVQELTKLAPDEAFGKFADALGKVGDQQERIFLGNEVLGGSYQNLVPLLNQGSEAINKAAQQAEQLGITVSRLDLRKAADVGIKISVLGKAMDALGTKVLAEFSDNINQAITFLGQHINEVVAAVAGVVRAVSEGISIIAEKVQAVKSGNFRALLPDQNNPLQAAQRIIEAFNTTFEAKLRELKTEEIRDELRKQTRQGDTLERLLRDDVRFIRLPN